MKKIPFILTISFCLSFVNTSIAQVHVMDSVAYFYNEDLDSLNDYLRQGYDIDYTLHTDSEEKSLTTLPKAVMKIPRDRLVSFECIECALEGLPKQFSRFKNLQEVSMSCRRYLAFIDKPLMFNEIFDLKGLKTLFLDGYAFDDISVIKAKELEKLTIRGSQLNVFPEVIFELTKLKKLELQDCKFSIIPDEINNLKLLKWLDIGGDVNREDSTVLTMIPETIGDLHNLETFLLKGATIKTLPKSLFDLPNLNRVYLEYTGIEYFPEDMTFNGELKYLTMFGGNRFKGFPNAIKDFPLESLAVFITHPSYEFLQNRRLIFDVSKNIDTYSEVIEGHYIEYENPEFIDDWEVFESSNDTLAIQLIPELDALTGKYFLCRGNQSYISNFYNDDVDNFSADLGFNIYKEGNLFFGEVNSSIAVLFARKYKDYPLYFHAEIDKETDIMTLTNRVGVVYKLRRFKK